MASGRQAGTPAATGVGRFWAVGAGFRARPSSKHSHLFSLNRDGLVMADQIAEAGVDGVVLVGMGNDDYLRAFTRWGTPGVVVDYCSPNVPLDFLACDNLGGAVRAVEHLAERGHRRVAYLDGGGVHRVRSTSDVAERREAALRELDRRGILASDGWISGGSGGEISGNLALAAEQWRAADPETRPTAFLAYDEWLALDLIKALDAQGVRVPEAVSVCAVAAAGGPAYHGQPLSCCCFDFLGMGIEAVRLPQFRENGDGLTGGKPAE